MKALLRAFGRRQVRRARAVALPALLAVSMMGLAVARLPAATTLWYETLTMTASVDTGEFECRPLSVTGGVAVEEGGKTTYSYTLSGGGARCKDISYVALPVCFDPELAPAGLVFATSQPLTFSYDPQSGGPFGKRVKWQAGAGAGSGWFNAVFSFTISGAGLPTVTVQAQTHPDVAASGSQGGSTPTDSGAVQVPWPASCGAMPASAIRGITTFGVSNTTGAGSHPAMLPTPTRTPRAAQPGPDVPPAPAPAGSGAQPGGFAGPTPTPTATPLGIFKKP